MRGLFSDSCKEVTLVALLTALFLPFFFAGCGGHATRGTASWYGQQYAGRATASGQIFDPNRLTAAHETLPLGTRVRVTNLDNGRSVVVMINDRFPGTKGRVIDLSQAAFRQLAPTEQGLARVKLDILD